MKIVIACLSLLLGFATSSRAQCGPPLPLRVSDLNLGWTNATCTNVGCSAGDNVNFLLQSFVVDFTCPPYTFEWNFGDGTSTNTSVPTINHVYNTPGTYNVTVRVVRSDAQVTVTRTLDILAPVPTLSFFALCALACCLGGVGFLLKR